MAEIVIAVAVLAVAVIPILATLSSANRGSVDVENEAQAVGLATEALEWVRALGFDDWCRALLDGGRNVKLPGEVRVGVGTLTWSEAKVVTFKADDGTTEIDYPESSNRFSREIVMTFVKGNSHEILAVRATVTVQWKLNVSGLPSRRVQMETILHPEAP
ncbi:MAG: hypothetical protein HY814_11725 [Candidatus Riflebacteria bacterium]|nr:hypothetical protein [Candidatus Riflebacteria bacterium]